MSREKTPIDLLPPKRRRFVSEYLIDLNGKQAAIRAGYSDRTAASQASDLLNYPNVQDALSFAMKQIADKAQLTAQMVIDELRKIGFANMQDFMSAGADGDPVLDFSRLTREQAAALQEVTVDSYMDGRGDDAREVKRVKFKLADKRAALVDLAKHLGVIVERSQVTHITQAATPEEAEQAYALMCALPPPAPETVQ